MLRLHIEPGFGAISVRDLGRADAKDFLLVKLRSGLDGGTVSIIYRTFRAMLSAAVDDEVIAANPIAKLWRALGLTASREVAMGSPRRAALLRETRLRRIDVPAVVREQVKAARAAERSGLRRLTCYARDAKRDEDRPYVHTVLHSRRRSCITPP